MHIVFLVPERSASGSGGHWYHRRMAAGLRETGHVVDVVELDCDPSGLRAKAPASRALDALSENARPVIDALAFPAFQHLAERLAGSVCGLVHHPTPVGPDRPEADRAAFRDLERRLFPRFAKMIATSTATAERLQSEFGVSGERIAVVVPGTEDAPRSRGSGGAGCALLSVGALVPRKGHDVLMRAVARMFDLDWSLTIVGSAARAPPHAHGLASLAEELGIAQRVRFAAEAENAQLDRLWRKADVFASATQWEGYGAAVAEALKRGLPLAISSAAAAAIVVPPDAGVICRPGDHEGLSKALRRVVFDEELRRHMADAAWQAGRLLPDWRTQARAFAAALQ